MKQDGGGEIMSNWYSHYDDIDGLRGAVAEGRHRDIIGGLWEALGTLQLDFLKQQGLQPGHTLIDIGCGSLRAGVPLTRYLDAGNYYGIDLRPELLEAGYDREIAAEGLAEKLPRDNLHATAEFDLSVFGIKFDYAIAQSVFTHMPISRLTDCLLAIRPNIKAGAPVYITFFERPEDADPSAPLPHEPGGIVTHPGEDPYDVKPSALRAACPPGWSLEIIGEWNHPRDQRMACFRHEG